MLKLEIRLDENKVLEEGKYDPEALNQRLVRAFEREHLDHTSKSDGTLVFVGRGRANDYGCFGKLITALKRQIWFMEYVEKWIWYNSDGGEDENDFAVEDVLLFYTNRASAA